jgi:hypothetical protein
LKTIKQKSYCAILLFATLIFSLNSLAFAEIISFSTDKNQYSINEQIIFSGTVGNNEEIINIVALNPLGDFQTILNEPADIDGSFEINYNARDFFTIKGIYKITAHTTDQPAYEGKALLFDFSGSTIKVLTTDSKMEQLDEPKELPPNCEVIKTGEISAVFCDDKENGAQWQVEQKHTIPLWVKQTALWWNQGNSADKEFIDSLSFLMKENIIQIPNLSSSEQIQKGKVPIWVKNNAGWWALGKISDNDFVNGISWLLENGIIQISSYS